MLFLYFLRYFLKTLPIQAISSIAGLKRTGKSCRLRWLNYLRPDVRRGNITLEEQLLILELHGRWGNRYENKSNIFYLFSIYAFTIFFKSVYSCNQTLGHFSS